MNDATEVTQHADAVVAALRPLARQFPTIDAALSEIARLTAELTLPKGAVHVISDVHGEDGKLRHVINNASGTLRPVVERLFAGRRTAAELRELLTLIFYPQETLDWRGPQLRDPAVRRAFAHRVLPALFDLVRTLARQYSFDRAARVLPGEYRDLLQELLFESAERRGPDYGQSIIDTLTTHGRDWRFIRLLARLVRNLAVDELVIAGDFWDRGHRGDRVMDYVMHQPHVAITWGNHDAAWLGACLGSEALIAYVLRVSARYRCLSQLEEGYGINLQPLEALIRERYDDDPASCFMPKGTGLRPTLQMARLQKAAAILQFKLEGQLIARNPHFGLESRRLLHRIDHAAGTVAIDGGEYALRDRHFPTIDPANPYELSPEERACMDRIRQSFYASEKLWEHMKYLVQRGAMYLVRDDHLIFHGCVPVDEQGGFLPLAVDGREYRGRDSFDAIARVFIRVLDEPRRQSDLDFLWYLWCGPHSPLFGKDKIATFEVDLVADPATHAEHKNPYFQLIHRADFCDRVLDEFGVDPRTGMIVNGHVPVKIEKGEQPLKQSGKAITIDGAFSRAYGDHGYTLVLESGRTFLAKHHHFDSVESAVRAGVDIIPSISPLREYATPRLVSDTERGDEIRGAVRLLEQLIDAYRRNLLRQGG